MSSAGSAQLLCGAAGEIRRSLGGLGPSRLDSLRARGLVTVGPEGVGPAGPSPACALRCTPRDAGTVCIRALGLVGGARPEEAVPCGGTFPGLPCRFELFGGELLVRSAAQPT